MNDFPLTLEEEVVANMVPMSTENLEASNISTIIRRFT